MKTYAFGAGMVLAGAVLAACSSGGGSPSHSQSSSPSPTSSGRPAARGARGPAAFGLIAAASPGTIEVQSPGSGQATVRYTASTTITATEATTRSAVTVGSCVLAAAKPSSSGTSGIRPTSFTAATVFVSAPANGKCAQGIVAAGRARGTGTGAPPSGFPSGRFPSGRPSGAAFGPVADGKVTASTGSTITVSGTDRRTSSTVTYTVTTTASTTYSHTVSATAKALVVGSCATANGKSDSTGAVDATSIRVTPATNGQCAGGFRGRRQ